MSLPEESELLIPLAQDGHGNLVTPSLAAKGQQYLCPCCGDEVIPRLGDIRVHHFAHHPGGSCTEETVTHKTAKLLVQRAVRDWKAGTGPAPEIERVCMICGDHSPQALPPKVTDAVLEHRLPEGFIVDVGLMAGNEVVAAVEILVSHQVDERKEEELSVPFVEIGGDEAIRSPTRWRALVDRFKPLRCPSCREAFDEFISSTREIAEATGVAIPRSYYRYAPATCYKCRKAMLVFTWPDHPDAPRVNPKPRTLQYRYSNMAEGKYSANTCPSCGALQGDWFLYNEPGGAFFSFESEENSRDARLRDLQRLAYLQRQRTSV